MWKLLLFGIAAAAYFGKQKLDQLFEGLSFEPSSLPEFKKNELGLVSTRFTMGLKIYNKSDVPVPIESVSGKVFSPAGQLSTFNIQQPFTIPGNGSRNVPLELTASNIEIFKSLIQLLLTGSTPKLTIKGGAFTVLGTAPIDITYDRIQLVKVKS